MSTKKLGCLLLLAVPAVAVGLILGVRFAAFYNPLRFADKAALQEATANGLMEDCTRILETSKRKYSHYLPKEDWPESVRILRPRAVFVVSRTGNLVEIILWRNYRNWARSYVSEKTRRNISLHVYSERAIHLPSQSRKASKSSRYVSRQITDRVYLTYPRKMEESVMSRTDLLQASVR